MKPRTLLAFTLIELLTVIAITAVLLTIIIVPVIQSFSMTRTAQAFGEAQDRARQMTDRIAREIGDAVGIRDLSTVFTEANFYGLIDGKGPAAATNVPLPANSIAIVVPTVNIDGTRSNNPQDTEVLLPYAKLDIVEPAHVTDPGLPPGMFRNPVNGKVDPTLKSPRGQVLLSVAQGQTMIRYWIGLRNPVSDDGSTRIPYNEPYTGFLTAQNGQRDNLYVLYRAEVQPYVRRPNKNTPNDATSIAWRPNLFLFQSDNATDTQIVDEDDPSFFTLIPGVDYTGTGQVAVTNTAKAARILHWMGKTAPGDNTTMGEVAHTTLQSDVSRYDMILPVYDKASRKVANVNGVPTILPMAQFRPTRITAETLAGQTATRLGEESASAAAIAPDVFTSQYVMWSNPVVRTYPVNWDPSTTGAPAYQVGRRDAMFGLALFAVPNGLADDTMDGLPNEADLFSIDAYQNAVALGAPFPFTQGILASNSGWLASLSGLPFRQVFTPYTINTVTGKIIASFSITDVGNPNNSLTDPVYAPGGGQNEPVVATCGADGNPYPAGTDSSGNPLDPNVTSGVFSDAQFASVNEKFNKLWHDYDKTALQGLLQRFIDLRVTPQLDGVHSPLYPDPLIGEATGFGRTVDSSGYDRYNKTSIVPGSEVVIGPDQIQGPDYGKPIRYSRVTQDPGPNQYRINYTDLPEPVDANNNLMYSVAFPVSNNPQTTYTPTDLVTAVLQPRFKAGYIQLESDPTKPIPAGSITVTYRFQISGRRTGSLATVPGYDPNAGNADSFSVDYDSRQLMNVLLTVRNYPQANNVPNPQTVTLKSSANVRNYIR